MNPLRIFKGFRELELRFQLAEMVQDKLRARVRVLEAVDIPALIASAIKAHEAKSVPCGRCGSVVDLTVRPSGPQLMVLDGGHACVCNECVPYAKRDGWRIATVGPPASSPADPAHEQEAAS